MIDASFRESIESATSQMVRVVSDGDALIVRTGALYPSGAPVTVDVREEGGSCFVSDSGRARLEGELLGSSSRLFMGQAQIVSEQLGVEFDQHSFFVLKVDISRVSGAIKVIGAASLKAATLTEARMSEQAEKNDRADLIDRLLGVFGPRRVVKDFEMPGSSTHAWNFAGSVAIERRKVLFDCTGPKHLSVYSAHAKFSDIARLGPDAPERVIAYSRRHQLKSDYRNLLQQTANLITIEEEDATYQRIASQLIEKQPV